MFQKGTQYQFLYHLIAQVIEKDARINQLTNELQIHIGNPVSSKYFDHNSGFTYIVL